MGGLIARDAVLQRTDRIPVADTARLGTRRDRRPAGAALRELLGLLDPATARRPMTWSSCAPWSGLAWHDQHEPQARAEGADEHIIAFLRERTLRTCPVGLIVLARYLLDCPDRTRRAGRLVERRAAGLVVYGENDDAWPPAVQDLMARQLGAERACIPGAAHSPAIEAPVTTASTLTAVLERSRAPAANCARVRPHPAGPRRRPRTLGQGCRRSSPVRGSESCPTQAAVS